MKDSIVVNVRMEPEQVRALDILAGTENRTRSGMLRKIITECLDVPRAVSYTHLRAHETPEHLVCRLLLEKKKQKT